MLIKILFSVSLKKQTKIKLDGRNYSVAAWFCAVTDAEKSRSLFCHRFSVPSGNEDILNRRKVELFYPLSGGMVIGLCDAYGFADSFFVQEVPRLFMSYACVQQE